MLKRRVRKRENDGTRARY